jgi:hypothetical protein
MLKIYVAVLGALVTFHVYTTDTVAASVLTTLCYVGGFLCVEAASAVGRKLRGAAPAKGPTR